VSQVDLHRHFHSLGAGVIEEVRVQRDKGFGFVRYSTHVEAALAIQMGNTHSYLSGRQMKVKLTNLNCSFVGLTILFGLGMLKLLCSLFLQCSWGSKPTPAGTASNPLPPPAPAPIPGFSASDLLAYERQLAMSKMAGMNPMMHHPQGQHAFKQAAMGATGSNQAIYDGGYQNAQQLMYYQ